MVCSDGVTTAAAGYSRFKNAIDIVEYTLKFPTSLGGNFWPLLFKQLNAGHITSYHKSPFLHRAVLCSFVLPLGSKVLTKRTDWNEVLDCIDYYRGPHTFLASLMGTRLLCEPGEDEG